MHAAATARLEAEVERLLADQAQLRTSTAGQSIVILTIANPRARHKPPGLQHRLRRAPLAPSWAGVPAPVSPALSRLSYRRDRGVNGGVQERLEVWAHALEE
jgi:hypothetical protein